MQTFLPFPCFKSSAKALDYKRLGKQRVEARQILNLLEARTNKKGFRNHPAVKMWKGYEMALRHYLNCCIDEWVLRGYKNTMEKEIIECNIKNITYPPWFGSKSFHASHRSNLLRKDYAFYKKYGWQEPTDLPYVWGIATDIPDL